MSERIDRREFIGAVAALAGGSLSGVLFSSGSAAGEGELAGLSALAPACESLRGNTVGSWYLARHPEDQDPARLMRSIFGEEGFELDNAVGLLDRLAESIRADYGSGNTLQVEGWTLSIREVQTCALVKLLRADASGLE